MLANRFGRGSAWKLGGGSADKFGLRQLAGLLRFSASRGFCPTAVECSIGVHSRDSSVSGICANEIGTVRRTVFGMSQNSRRARNDTFAAAERFIVRSHQLFGILDHKSESNFATDCKAA